MRLFGHDETAAKAYFRGTHRIVEPAETLRRFSPHLAEIGITRIADITGLDAIGLPVYVAIRPNSRALSTAQGKGFDHDSAKASAMMESIESWHAERAQLLLVHDSHRALARDHAADPCTLPAQAGATPRVDVPYLWARGWDLIRGHWMYVPFELVTANYVFPPGYRPTFRITSNGLASGNCALEAVNHALCEVIERDAHALWSLRSPDDRRATAVALATVEDPACRQVLELLASAGVGVRAWDMTSDLGVPAYAVQICDPPDRVRWRPVGVAGGFGCHLAPAVALMRALGEAVQSRLTMIWGSRDDQFHAAYDELADRDSIARTWQSWPRRDDGSRFDAREPLDTPAFESDVEALVARLRAAGITSATVVDLTRAELGVPVVKVVVAGLESHCLGAGYRRGPRAAAARGVRV